LAVDLGCGSQLHDTYTLEVSPLASTALSIARGVINIILSVHLVATKVPTVVPV
jgi:hypothetical protein